MTARAAFFLAGGPRISYTCGEVPMQPQDLLSRLRVYALRIGSPTVDLASFLRTLSPEQAELEQIEAAVRDLSFRGALVIPPEGARLTSVTFPDFPQMLLDEEYRRIAEDPARCFPDEHSLPVAIPESDVFAVEAKTGLGELLQGDAPEVSAGQTHQQEEMRPPSRSPGEEMRPPSRSPGIVKLLFPENVPALLVPRSFIGTRLVLAAVEKIGRYLQDPKNAAYADVRMRTALRGSDVTVRQMLEDISARARMAATGVMSPTDFSVRFWGHLSNAVVADVGAKTERTGSDLALLQSAHLVAFAAIHRKGASERAQEKAADRRGLEAQVRKAPFVFTSVDLFALKDEKGELLSVKHGRDFLSSFITEKTMPAEGEALPFLVRFKDFFVQRDLLVPVFLNKLGEASEALRLAYVREWVGQMRQDSVPPISRSDALFHGDVERRVREEFPLLTAMADGRVLALAARSPAVPEESREELARCFEREAVLGSFPVLLGLVRARLLKDTHVFLPFWQTVPIIGAIVRFLRLLFRPVITAGPEQSAGPGGRPMTHAPAAGNVKNTGEAKSAADAAAVERMHRAVQSMIAHFVPAGRTVDRALEELIEKWNPLLEAGPKRDLVRDVNALAQDFIRPIRHTFLLRPPDLDRITALAEQLAASRSLAMIQNREPLLRYLSLVMLRSILSRKP